MDQQFALVWYVELPVTTKISKMHAKPGTAVVVQLKHESLYFIIVSYISLSPI